ncbi:MAG: restriction endonuclease subunit S [Myxococcales bacterium]|nr:restriction endonuclease subunit S [Myxococcales bacterium]
MADASATWPRLRFGEFARNVQDRVDDPSTAGVEVYVGLEHLDPDSLKIRRWGSPDDVSATKLRFRPGDVIFGKRRAYQRKLGVAEIEGIASAHSFVLRSNSELLVPGYLPHFMLSDAFMTRAERISVGSLSPTINWKTLAGEEFAVPPQPQQTYIIGVLGPLETARVAAVDALAAGEDAFGVLTWQATTGALAAGPRQPVRSWRYARLPGVNDLPSTWAITTLTDVARLESGHTPSKRRDDYWNGGIPWISLADIKRLGVPEIDSTEHEVAQLGLENSSTRLLPRGTVVLSRTAMIGFTSVMGREMATSQDFANFVCDEKRLLPRFLFYLFLSMREYFDYIAIGSSNVNTIYMPFFKRMQIPLPPFGEQAEIVELLDDMWAGLEALRARVASHASLLHATREALIGRGAP